jgi:hypothetical protein
MLHNNLVHRTAGPFKNDELMNDAMALQLMVSSENPLYAYYTLSLSALLLWIDSGHNSWNWCFQVNFNKHAADLTMSTFAHHPSWGLIVSLVDTTVDSNEVIWDGLSGHVAMHVQCTGNGMRGTFNMSVRIMFIRTTLLNMPRKCTRETCSRYVLTPSTMTRQQSP